MSKRNLLYILFLFLVSCTKSIDIQTLHSSKSLIEFKEGIFFQSVWNIQEERGNFYFNDYEGDHIFVTDSSLNLIKVLGQTGSGPGEFKGAGPLYVRNDSVYGYDDGGMRMNIFTIDGGFKRTFALPDARLEWTRFTILNKKIYVPSALNSNIMVLNFNGNLIKEIETSQRESVKSNSLAILHYQDQIIALNRATPFVKRYSKNGILVETFDLSTIQELHELWTHYEDNQSQDQSKNTTILFEDAYVHQSFLYLLCAGWPNRDDYSYVIKLSLDKKKTEPHKVFKIQGRKPSGSVFGSFAIKGDRLIAFEQLTSVIFEFNLAKLK